MKRKITDMRVRMKSGTPVNVPGTSVSIFGNSQTTISTAVFMHPGTLNRWADVRL